LNVSDQLSRDEMLRDEKSLNRIKTVKFKIIEMRTGCQCVGCFHCSWNLNWGTQNLRLGRMQPACRGFGHSCSWECFNSLFLYLWAPKRRACSLGYSCPKLPTRTATGL